MHSKNLHNAPTKGCKIIAAHLSKIGNTIGNKIMCVADFALCAFFFVRHVNCSLSMSLAGGEFSAARMFVYLVLIGGRLNFCAIGNHKRYMFIAVLSFIRLLTELVCNFPLIIYSANMSVFFLSRYSESKTRLM